MATRTPGKKKDPSPTRPNVALVLQGGGALGVYQAGVYQALHERNLTPDWVVGTSIGAINAAIIAGNPRETRITRLRQFWEGIAHDDALDMNAVADATRQLNTWLLTMDTFARGVPGFFSPRPFNPFAMGLPVPPENASFYDTSALRTTLEGLVDFDYLNSDKSMRLTVSAVKVATGTLVNFDSSTQRIGPEHIMASGALPPGFAPIRVDGDLYWDGGLYSNTPLEVVLDDAPGRNTLCVMVDLWHADGNEPRTLEEVQTRQKDVTFASRSQRHIDAYLHTHQMRRQMRDLYERLPAATRKHADLKDLAALENDGTIHILRLAYAGRDWNMASKDVNFARGSIEWRWEQGYNDALKAIDSDQGWIFEPTDAGVVVHEYGKNASEK
ncbi:patatin-like phospholipase family protein [Herbaspirillum sp. RTI4]|uniref:patatin-like phospholipase family protein n=1 Tax=Herbaspirillum sp. RTI4 TaxID=3048640 RepID=UPI002AB552CE|nr:patatin-like phospholipase family protein [Herbaspirillum sp. RTI4]MDY7577294.1 patatin-like phospholipase family protein [Herbaspirillum sp. RTI4]MEA9982940.1 patatin-like phospholipase family protein [Herbaspirillum sp. RTI4]